MSGPFARFRERRQEPQAPMVPGLGLLGQFKTYSNGNLSSTLDVTANDSPTLGIERTWDSVHVAQQRHGSRVFRDGGPFVNIKTKHNSHEILGSGTFSNIGKPGITLLNRTEYVGGFANPTLAPSENTVPDYSLAGGPTYTGNPLLPSMTGWESKAWDIAPKIEKWSLANALYELKDVPGQIRQTARFFHDTWKGMGGQGVGPLMKPDRLASDFLNVQFGWIPFVNDVTALCKGVIFSDYFLNQITRENNTWVKKYRILSESESSSRIYFVGGPGCKPTGANIDAICAPLWEGGPRSTYEVFSDVNTVIWAKGLFKYYRPEFDSSMPYYGSTFNKLHQQMLINGLTINPSHIWKAIPWSWAVDWFSNIGSIIDRSRQIAEDGLVSKYLYLMHHQVKRIRGLHKYNFYSGVKVFQSNRLVETKQRKGADSPYGFVLGGDLSLTQWSILAALGLSRNVNFAKSF